MLGFLSRFVDSNDRELKRIQPFVDEANDLEEEIKALTDAEIRERFTALRDEFRETVVDEEPSDDELHHPDLERRRELRTRGLERAPLFSTDAMVRNYEQLYRDLIGGDALARER